MKKVLIVSDFFFPSANIAAVRPSKIAKRLTADGYCVDVFTRYPIGEGAGEYCNKCFSFQSGSALNVMKKEENVKRTGIKKILFEKFNFLYMSLLKIKSNLQTNRKNKQMLDAFKTFIAENPQEYDAVFTTFGPVGSSLCGLYYKKKFPQVKWICDFRDPAVVSQCGPLKNFFRRLKEQKSCRLADEIVTVSNGYMKRICGDKYTEKRHMIPNGYDRADMVYSGEKAEASDKLSLAYVGIFYGFMRDLRPVFRAIKELVDEGLADKDKICINYAGSDNRTILAQAEECSVKDFIVTHGVLAREDCLKLQFGSDILLLSTWNTEKECGVFPGKLLEYMLIGKPIVTTVTGDVPDSEVAQVVREGNLGIVYEEVNGKEDFAKLKEYILTQYNYKVNGKELPFNPEQSVLDRYNYDTIIKRIEALIEG
ncbi:MAG: glycosyltransferase [Acutalibacteraceae bacterium]|nr:glycosyltransferase [Acutalibacteraceae bacterium]